MPPFLETLRQVVSGQLRSAIAADPGEADAHVRFVITLLAAGAGGLVLVPVWLALGAPGGIGVVVLLACAVSPLPIAALVLRTGQLALGRQLSLLVIVGLVATIVAMARQPIAAAATAALGSAGLVLWPRVAKPFAAGRSAAPFETEAPVPTALAGDIAFPQYATDLGGSIEALVGLSARLADRRVALSDDEADRMVRLIRAAGVAAQRSLDTLTGSTTEPAWDEGETAPGDLAALLERAVTANAALAAERGVLVRISGADELLSLPMTEHDYRPILAGFVAAGLRTCRAGGGLLAAVDQVNGRVRIVLRAGYAALSQSGDAQPFLQPHSPYTAAGREDGLGLAEVSRRIAALGGAFKLGRRGPGGVIVALHLPVAAIDARGGDRHPEERHIEVRKSA